MSSEAKDKGGREIAVTVNYQARSETKAFERNSTVEEVLLWAVVQFNIDPSMATEFELTETGQKEELPGSRRLAALAKGDNTLALDLVRGDIANGYC